MTKAQANALMTALEVQKMNASANMAFDAAGVETWAVQLDPKVTYTGAQLAQLAAYCANNNLNLSVIIEQMGVT